MNYQTTNYPFGMNYPKYDIESSSSEDIFEFVSTGSNGAISKLIQFRETPNVGLYNLAFGDKREDGTIDDKIESNNGDMEMVLATVASTAYEYTSTYPDRLLIFHGSTPARTRLYRMAICKNYEELNNDFDIFGVIPAENGNIAVPFERNKPYIAFVAKRKPLKLEP